MTDKSAEEYWRRVAPTLSEDQTYIVGEAIQQEILDRLSGERDLGELVELGCGGGYYTPAVAKNAKHVVATDLSDAMLAVARTRLKDLPNVTVENADCMGTPYPSERFDSVFLANMVHVLEDPSSALREGHRILKSGGLLLVMDITMHGMGPLAMLGAGMKVLRRWGKPPGYFKGKLRPDELRSLVEAEGFEVESLDVLGDGIKALYLRGRKK